MADKKEPAEVHLLPEGRLINSSFFEKDVYTPPGGKPGVPSYKCELAFEPASVEGENTIEDAILDCGIKEWGPAFENEYLDGKVICFIDGNKLAAARAEKGKEGEAYKGKLVCRPHTTFNKDGADAPGGIQVWDENVKPVTIANQGAVYNGCFGQAAVTLKAYTNSRGEKGVTFYLVGFQKTKDGERFAAARDTSTLFKPVGKPAGEAGAGGRRRRG